MPARHISPPPFWPGGAVATAAVRCVLQRRQASFLAKTRSLQLGQIQSPGIMACVGGAPTTPALVTATGLGVPQRLHCEFRANCRSWHVGQNQSPVRGAGVPLPPPLPAPKPPMLPISIENTPPCTMAVGLAVKHFRQLVLRAKTRSPQFGHVQSPGFEMRSCIEDKPSCMALRLSKGFGFAAPHRLHAMFFANCRSPQLGQVQSPGFCGKLLPEALVGFGLASPHLLHLAFLANWKSLQAGQYQSPGFRPQPPRRAVAEPLPASRGLAAPHFRHCVFLAN
mmetsp:Transcript_96493/g.268165  ORF Transcript_96493/g.268165 Transcript_96493/m.268165 type:complete len:281 (+) Transcript_96493:680-1522(+)